MTWKDICDWILVVYLGLYLLVAVVTLIVLPALVARPPWYHPNPGKNLSDDSVHASWVGATTPQQLNVSFEEVTFLSTDGVRLRGWLIHAHSQALSGPFRKAVACVHGAGRDRRAFLRHAVFLSEAGFDVLLFDCSNHGSSDFTPTGPRVLWTRYGVSLGKREHHDVIAAVQYLKSLGVHHVAVLGTSQGASAAIIAAAKCGSINALVLENPFCSPASLIRGIITSVLRQIPLPFFVHIMTKPVLKLSLFHTGNLPVSAQVRAIDYISHVKCPLLFIHGTSDGLVHFRESKALYRAINTRRKYLWLVKGAQHTLCFHTKPDKFKLKVTSFLRRYLVDAPGSQSSS